MSFTLAKLIGANFIAINANSTVKINHINSLLEKQR